MLRKLLLEKEEEGEESLVRNHKKIDLKDASYMIGTAWNGVKEQNLRNAWNKILSMVENCESEDEEQNNAEELLNMLKELDCHECDEEAVQEWLSVDDANRAG